ncbi:ATP-binding protein [Chloroflexota bacterium]
MKWLRKSKGQEPKDEIAVQLSLADKVSRRVIHSSSALEVAQGTIHDLQGLMLIDWAALSLLSESSDQVSIRTLLGNNNIPQEKTFSLSGTAIAWVINEKQALLQVAPQQDDRFTQPIADDPDIKALIHMPLFYQGIIYGVISVGGYQPEVYTDSQLRLLRHAVAHLAISVKSALLLEQNIKTEALLTDLNDLLTIITSKPDLPTVFPEFAERLKKVISFDRLSLSVIEGNVVRPLALYSDKASYPQLDDVVPMQDTALSWMVEHKEINIEQDFTQQKEFAIDKRHVEDGYKAEMRLPLLSHGKLFAGMHLLSTSPYEIKEEKEFLAQLAHYLSAPVESYLLYLYENQRISWLSALSHHLRTPLTPISATGQLLLGQLKKGNDDRLVKMATNIVSGADNLKDNLNLFWDISEVESAFFELSFDIINLKKLIDTVVLERSAVAARKSQSIAVDLPESLPDVDADGARIRQVLTSFLSNAIEVSSKDCEIGLKVKLDGQDVIVEISDCGQTMTPEDIESLLTPYSFSDSDMRTFPKLTLKLAFCIKLIKLHGGKIWIEGIPDGGNRFFFCLPVAR